MHINAKEREKKDKGEKRRKAKKRKGIKTERVKPSTPSQAIDAHIGDEEQNGKQKKNKKKKRSGSPTRQPQTIWSPLMTHMNHTVGLF